MPTSELQAEWKILHKNIEQYEQFALVIKLFAVFICLLALTFTATYSIAAILIAILWLQEGIWKTFQSRLESHILITEAQLKEDSNKQLGNESGLNFQLYSHWMTNRPNAVQLISQYITCSLKPTVMYPYALLIFVLLFNTIY